MSLRWISDWIIKIRSRMRESIDDFRTRRKIFVFYVFCVLIPLLVTDSFIIYVVLQSEQAARQHVMENVANAVQYNFANRIESAADMARNLFINRSLNDFLDREYEDALEYVTAYYDYFQKSIFDAGAISNNIGITLYTDNDTIVKGGRCNSIKRISESEWCRELMKTDSGSALVFLYDDSRSPVVEAERKVFFARKMDYYNYNDSYEKILVLTLNYSNMAHDLVKMNYGMPVYICCDDTILLSNGSNSVRKDFDKYTVVSKNVYAQNMKLYGKEFTIYVQPPKINALEAIKKNLLMIMLLLVVNITLPSVVIQTIFVAKMKEQEMIVARQNAELLALHSQINPHFLFNALESIRMHSILKTEFETAESVERLALLQRQYLEWGNDSIEIREEMEFVIAYLELQKYRFGDRLTYELDIQKECEAYKIPKLTIVTFVENACVHGIESKTSPGWIFVRIYEQKDSLYMEIEDTGMGMEEQMIHELQYRMENASIEMLKDKGRVGIVNACLRLKMMSHDEVSFTVEGEMGIGTIIQMKVPLRCV